MKHDVKDGRDRHPHSAAEGPSASLGPLPLLLSRPVTVLQRLEVQHHTRLLSPAHPRRAGDRRLGRMSIVQRNGPLDPCLLLDEERRKPVRLLLSVDQ